MGKNNGRFGHPERRAHGVIRDVGKVHQHAEAIHFADYIFAKRRESVMIGRFTGGVGPVEICGVGQSHVTRAERVRHAQHR